MQCIHKSLYLRANLLFRKIRYELSVKSYFNLTADKTREMTFSLGNQMYSVACLLSLCFHYAFSKFIRKNVQKFKLL